MADENQQQTLDIKSAASSDSPTAESIDADEALKRADTIRSLEKSGATESSIDVENTIEHVTKAQELEKINTEETLKRVARIREIEREKILVERERLSSISEAKQHSSSGSATGQDDIEIDDGLEEDSGGTANESKQLMVEQERKHQAELIDSVNQQFRVSGNKFLFKDHTGKIAFKDKGEKLISPSNDQRASKAMAQMAEAKGWQTIKVSGHPEFRRDVWMEGNLRGINVSGFKPSEKDLSDLEKGLERKMTNRLEKVGDSKEQAQSNIKGSPTQGKEIEGYKGKMLEHGADHYNHDTKQAMNYYVSIETANGPKKIWGVDLERAIAEGKSKIGDEVTLKFKGKQPVTIPGKNNERITTHRNTWEVKNADERLVVGSAADAVIASRTSDPKKQAVLKDAVNKRLTEQHEKGKGYEVPIYDNKAPSKASEQQRDRPQVEQNSERSR